MCGFLVMTRPTTGDTDADRCWRDDAHFVNALRSLDTRGPDGRGQWRDEHVAMGHTRLAIIDIVGGTQPMTSPDQRCTLVYNGELYNFQQLRRELEAKGAVFRTRSDTEVVLEAIRAWGTDALARFDGMFALAFWDAQSRSMLLARDRVGVKPAFYSTEHGQLVAGSTLAPFWSLPQVSKRVDRASLRDYFAQQTTGPNRSILEAVKPLAPGTWLRYHVDERRIQKGRFWDIPEPVSAMAFDELVEATDTALRESVRRQLVSDVPLGVLFSGGIDSSLLTWYMTQVGGQSVKTFTVKFDQSAKHDEAPIARQVASALGTDHHELQASQLDADDLQQAIARMDQPFGDASYLPVLKLAALAREHVTVGIGGDGGDEVFGGYPRYLKDTHHYPDYWLYRTGRRLAAQGLLPASLYRAMLRGDERVMRAFTRMGDYPVTTRAIRSIIKPGVIELWQLDALLEDWLANVRRWSGRLDTDSLLRADLWHFLGCNGLVKTDRATMASSLEARVPMLGNDVLDLVLPQPAEVRVGNGLKSVLIELAKRHLPAAAWDRTKRGFTVPVSQYMTGPWRPYVDHLFEQADTIAPFLDGDEVRRRWRAMCDGQTIDWPAYGTMVMLGWLESHPVEIEAIS